MNQPARTQPLAQRGRHLNIVYFVESARTHSIRISLAQARWILAISTGVVLWAMISIVWIASLDSILGQTRGYLQTALSNIFEYQVKYDHVFDAAYPEEETPGYYAEGSHLSSNNPVIEEASAKQASKVGFVQKAAEAIPVAPVQAAVASEVGATPKPQDVVVPPAAALPSGVNDKLLLTHIKLSQRGHNLTMVFDVTNSNQKKKAEGYIWAVLELPSIEGKSTFVGAPEHARFDSVGKIINPSSAYRFSIQRFKKKDFQFKISSNDRVKIASAKIYYSSLSGKDIRIEDVPSESLAVSTANDVSTPKESPTVGADEPSSATEGE